MNDYKIIIYVYILVIIPILSWLLVISILNIFNNLIPNKINIFDEKEPPQLNDEIKTINNWKIWLYQRQGKSGNHEYAKLSHSFKIICSLIGNEDVNIRHICTRSAISQYCTAVQIWEKKIEMADSQSPPENQLKRLVLIWVTVNTFH